VAYIPHAVLAHEADRVGPTDVIAPIFGQFQTEIARLPLILHRFPEPSIRTLKKLDAGEALARSKPIFAKSRSGLLIERR
jgi:hypothetical protein